ncbi:hypothetical protein, partial [Escherichia coli]|uniref:hypothetical protein n=1 Tax=Escherichia coli TaxID=562 RepID=UPI001C609FAC
MHIPEGYHGHHRKILPAKPPRIPQNKAEYEQNRRPARNDLRRGKIPRIKPGKTRESNQVKPMQHAESP